MGVVNERLAMATIRQSRENNPDLELAVGIIEQLVEMGLEQLAGMDL